ncbi:MAG: hypothetical protein GXY07_02125 [Candidatus Hydrogenedentes bacterium]|nr:hypothetical protein [Candidatus Hydrogenedentota bacterium]
MDDIIGFLIFVGIVAVSIIGKIKSERKTAEERNQQPSPPLTLDELPETTRRMLYGEGDIIVATPRQTAPRPEPSVPRPAPPPPVPARQIVVERPRPVMAPQAPRVPPVRTAAPPRQQPAASHQQLQRPQQQRRYPAQSPPAPARPQPQPSRPPGREQPVAARSNARPSGSVRSSRAPGREKLVQTLQCRSGLAQAVLLREILGPPRAFDL